MIVVICFEAVLTAATIPWGVITLFPLRRFFRLPGGDHERAVMRVASSGRVGPELENLRIHIHPSGASKHIFVICDAAIMNGKPDIIEPALSLGIILV